MELALAYLKARYADPMSSFGDFIALSHTCNVETANLIKREVSDGIIAPDYEEEALEILKSKKGSNYLILKGDNTYKNKNDIEYREIFGMALSQTVNKTVIGLDVLKNRDDIPENNGRDTILANLVIKYAKSNNVAIALNGAIIGIGSGQQVNIDCVKLCSRKVINWRMRHHPKVLAWNKYYQV